MAWSVGGLGDGGGKNERRALVEGEVCIMERITGRDTGEEFERVIMCVLMGHEVCVMGHVMVVINGLHTVTYC